MQVQQPQDGSRDEHAAYFQVPGAHLYTVLHAVAEPVARVLLVGPFASERHNCYLAWVLWARYLAGRGVEVLRYDYRGIGESTGQFEEMDFQTWMEDVRLLSAWLKDRSPQVPLILHGFELGALLAGKAFDEGTGDGLILWSPPLSANHSLRSTFMRWIGMKQLYTPAEERRPASHYFQRFADNQPLSVEGYMWSAALWQNSFNFDLPPALAKQESAAAAYSRPVRIANLGKSGASLLKGGSIGYEELRNFDVLFADNFKWLASALSASRVCAL